MAYNRRMLRQGVHFFLSDALSSLGEIYRSPNNEFPEREESGSR